MRCLHCHSSVLLLHSQLKHKHKQELKAKEQLCLFSNETPRLVLQRQKNGRNSILALRTNAISNPLFNIAAKIPPSKSGDITAFLQTRSKLFLLQQSYINISSLKVSLLFILSSFFLPLKMQCFASGCLLIGEFCGTLFHLQVFRIRQGR